MAAETAMRSEISVITRDGDLCVADGTPERVVLWSGDETCAQCEEEHRGSRARGRHPTDSSEPLRFLDLQHLCARAHRHFCKNSPVRRAAGRPRYRFVSARKSTAGNVSACLKGWNDTERRSCNALHLHTTHISPMPDQ